ncbi:MAG TPA: ATPase, T2SS/T4P/T4SS family [Candidatus Dormibacteraeota bacterium]|jgi:pilus assembly protein CpaF
MVSVAERVVRRRVREALGELWDEVPTADAVARDQQVRQTVHRELVAYNREAVTTNEPMLSDPDQLERQLLGEMFGLGRLQALMEDKTVDNIFIDSPTRVDKQAFGLIERTDVCFEDDDEVRNLVRRVARQHGRTIDESNPRVDVTLQDGSRLHAVMPPITRQYTQVAIRKFTRKGQRLEDLAASATFTPDAGRFLAALVQASANIVVSGRTGTGKTTLLGALGLAIDDPEQRIVTLEETRELALDLYLPRCTSWQGRPKNAEGKGLITLRDLLQEDALRMEPARIILGEARAAEALDILRAMNTGHEGSLTTVHASSARAALSALRNLALQSPDRFDVETVTALIADAVDVVIHLRKVKQPGGGFRREVSEIFELTEQEHPLKFNGQQLWARDRDGNLVRTGIRPRILAKIEEAEVSYRWEPTTA